MTTLVDCSCRQAHVTSWGIYWWKDTELKWPRNLIAYSASHRTMYPSKPGAMNDVTLHIKETQGCGLISVTVSR